MCFCSWTDKILEKYRWSDSLIAITKPACIHTYTLHIHSGGSDGGGEQAAVTQRETSTNRTKTPKDDTICVFAQLNHKWQLDVE